MRILWVAARLIILLATILAFRMLNYESTNFGIIAGLICGIVIFVGLFLWIRIKDDNREHLNLFDAPFWPMQKFPRAYWSTIGLSIVIASLVNMAISIRDPHAVQLFGGLTALGLGMALAVLCTVVVEKRGGK